MLTQFSRTALLFGEKGVNRLRASRVAVFGLGGVGGYAAEALARSGIGTLGLFDHDTICLSNINRQILATHKTVGRYKVEVARERILDINPDAQVIVSRLFYSPETSGQVDLSVYDYVVDAIDTVTCKLELIVRSKKANVPVISCMGAGNKINAWALEVADIYETCVCPLAKVMRAELRKRNIASLKVVYSKETPLAPDKAAQAAEDCAGSGTAKGARRQIPGSNAFVPAAAGLIMAGEVVKDLIGLK